jgi:uncharacterized protein YfaS (alpha-2-macroglobulin family)
MTCARFSSILALVLFAASAAAQPPPRAPLRIVSAGPTGEVAAIEEADEIRVVFSESMVALGRVPASLRVPFFRITPSVAGTFRWSGASVLVFTPARRLPLATRYEVTIDGSAASISGRTLGEPYTFTFTTPTVRLLQTRWYRPGGRYDAAPVVLLRFNQPVRPQDVASHLIPRFQVHPFTAPFIDDRAQARLRATDPGALPAFEQKVSAARTASSASGQVDFRVTENWDKKTFPPARDLVVVEITTPVPPDSWVRLDLDGRIPSLAGAAVSGHRQDYTIEFERTFFIDGFFCRRECDPEGSNTIRMRAPVKTNAFAAAISAVDVSDPRQERIASKAEPKKRTWERDESFALTLEDGGVGPQPPATTWIATISASLRATDGQTLGYTWAGAVENWHQRAFTSFGDGHGVWETGGGGLLPFYSRNFVNVRQWAAPVDPAQLMSTVVKLRGSEFHLAPAAASVDRKLTVVPDSIQSHGLDLSKALTGGNKGLVWTAVEEGTPIERAHVWRDNNEPVVRASLVQVTNLGISVKDSPLNTLIFVTRLDNAAPVPDAHVAILKPDGSTLWRGTTGKDGVAMAPETRLRDPRRWYEFAFLITAEKDGDVAYAASDWNEGLQSWEFGVPFSLNESDPLLRGTVFSDRGVYRLGEEVHFKAVLRSNTPSGVKLLPAGTEVFLTTRDSRNRVVDERTIKLNAWSAGEWTLTLPGEGSLGNYMVRAVLQSDRPAPGTQAKEKPAAEEEEGEEEQEDGVPWYKAVQGSFLVAAYRKPDFRVDVTLKGDSAIAGESLKGLVRARYLFGAAMQKRPVKWTFTRTPAFAIPTTITATFPQDRWSFAGWQDNENRAKPDVAADTAQLTTSGDLPLDLPTDAKAGTPYAYTLEADVEDVSRQHIANRAALVVHPAPWYVGIKRLPYFIDQKAGLGTSLVAVGLDGTVVPGVAIDVTLKQIQWISARRAEGNSFYTWETERKEVPAGEWHLTSASEPVPFNVPLSSGGYFVLTARADADAGRFTTTTTSFYVMGQGYTAWERYDHNRINLVAERTTYKPGETARIMIQSPWETATALLTTEREGIRSYHQFALTSTQQSIEVPLTEADIPNLFVSVMLVKGRTIADASRQVDDPADPGKPSFRIGYVQLHVEDASKRLTVAVAANREEYRPANTAAVEIDVKDAGGRPSASEVTLWAVDYGVLSLTSYRTPDVLESVYVPKALAIMNEDSRQRIVSRRVLSPKGASDGGGGGDAGGPGSVRRDFRTLAFWLGSIATDARGHARVDVKLPESLTTYRIMAVAGDRASRFGSADTEIRINKLVTMKPTFPRFLALGDKATFGAVVTSQLKTPGSASVTIASLDPSVLSFADGSSTEVQVGAGGSTEVRFEAMGRAIGRARVRMTVRIGDETDAFEDVVPVEVLVSPETVSAVGETDSDKIERLRVPDDVAPGFGGLRVDLSSTALVGLADGARYLVEYPYGCAEQRGSRALALLLTADLGDAFALQGIDPSKLRSTVQSTLKELEKYQCENGGFAYWPGQCWSTSPYLTAYLLHVFQVAADLKYSVNASMRERAYTYLQQKLAEPPPTNESWWPSYTAWQAFAVKVLAEGGRNQDSNITRLYGYRERMPVFALAYLSDAMVARGERSGPRIEEITRRIGNSILPEGASAHVEELSDPYLLWFWNSNVRSTAIVLNSMMRAAAQDAPYRQLVAWMMRARTNGRWGNTQENALALESLVSYYRRFEAEPPDFAAAVSLQQQQIARSEFRGRTTEARGTDVPMSTLLASGQPGSEHPLTFSKTGRGTLFYSARLRYAEDRLFQQGHDGGMHVERSYAPYVENGTKPASTVFKAGDLVRVTLTLVLTKERRWVAVTDPLPAGFEPVESWFATSAAALTKHQDDQGDVADDWFAWWQRGGFDHVERYDDRVQLFATRLSEGRHQFTYIVRATTSGVFRTAPAHAEEMYEPEVFGRTQTTVVTVK